MASTTPLRLPWVNYGESPDPDDFKLELYNIDKDFSQADNLAATNPEKLKEMQQICCSGMRKRSGSEWGPLPAFIIMMKYRNDYWSLGCNGQGSS